ncbi:calcium-dependent protein kinase 6 [Plasmodium gonderi]|uniref:non-specific serine/threonine protein kinase n=1 Tax=Plasmodium gonderi TaxID=77519 RepID=A0A1Y1JER2_PLAGO|nr:calcium-dependent protein kinase 6 [Plasmodium gonderi]GAW80996.1 calcium-dependent protein kinase 6 [Plasmodium gonderi]
MKNSANKQKRKNKNKFTLHEEKEKDRRNVESVNNENSFDLYEEYNKNVFPNTRNRVITIDASLQISNNKNVLERNKVSPKGLYINSKENIHYGSNENELFAEDIFENENFHEVNFVEDENMEYKTYNSYTNSKVKLLSKYLFQDKKKKTDNMQKKNKISKQEQQLSYKEYYYNNESSKENHNEFDSDIIKFLNRNKKSIEYDKQNEGHYKKGVIHTYDSNNKYNIKREKQKNYHVVKEDKNNHKHYQQDNADYYDAEQVDQDNEKEEREEGEEEDQERDNNSYSDDDRDNNGYSNDDGDKSSYSNDDGDKSSYSDDEGDNNDYDPNDNYYDGIGNLTEKKNCGDQICKHFLKNAYKNINMPTEGGIYDKKEEDYFEKEIMNPIEEDNKWNITAYDNYAGMYGNKNNYEIKFGSGKSGDDEEENIKNKEQMQNKNFVKINLNEINLKKTYIPCNKQHNIQRNGMEIKSPIRNTLNIGKPNLSINKYNFNTLNREDNLIKFNINANIRSSDNKPNGKEERISEFEYMPTSLRQNVYEGRGNYFLEKREAKRKEDLNFGEVEYKDHPFREEIEKKDINTEEKKKKNIKNFLDKIKRRKSNEDFLKRECSKYENSEKIDKKDKFKMKFTDILYTRTLGNFFSRNKNNIAKSLSPQRERDSSIDSSVTSSNTKKFDPNNYRKQHQKHDQFHDHNSHHGKNRTLLHMYAIKEELKYYKTGNSEKRLDNISNEEKIRIDNADYYMNSLGNEKVDILDSDGKTYDKGIFHKMPNVMNKQVFSSKRFDSCKFYNHVGVPNSALDNKINEYNKSSGNRRKSHLENLTISTSKHTFGDHTKIDDNTINSNSIINGIYNKSFHSTKYDLDAVTSSRQMIVKENIPPQHLQLCYKSTLGREKAIIGSENNQKEKDIMTQELDRRDEELDSRDEELDVKMDQTLSRKMIENNELKKRNENNDDVLTTPFYIKSKIDKVLKNSEIFERSARATFQQFDVKNKNFLHFSEIESLIQKLCFNLELPPVDKNILSIVYKDYDSSKNNSMNYTDFRQMYWDLLKQIKKKYYPTKNLKIKRNCIISRKKLGGYGYSSIYNYLSFKKILGCGAFGEVHLVEDNICKIYKVVKILKKKKLKNIKINEEINVLIYLDHPNIIKIFDVYENVDCTYIVMELCEGGELMDKVMNSAIFNEEYIKNIMFQILCAIAYMHSNNIAHKDLKPENILFKAKGDDTLKIIDFGLAELINQTEGVSKTAAGTILYMAPEVFKKNFTIKCDIWSAGVIMFFLFSKNLPFWGNTYEEIKLSIFKDEPDYKSLKGKLSQPALHMLKLMLQKDHTKRPMAAVLLHHPWFQGFLDPIVINQSTLNNIKSYMKQSNIRNIIVNIMAHELSVIDSHLKYINNLFCKIDTNHNGSLSHGEIYSVLSNTGIKKWDINRIVQALDINDRGSINYTEFIAGCYQWKNIESTFLKAAFNKIDKDEDGYISKSDIVTLMNDKVIESHDVDNFFMSVFRVKKGLSCERRANRINFEDFKAYLLSTF